MSAYDASLRLTKQYISLMLRLRSSSFLGPKSATCLQAGHLKKVVEGSTACAICAGIAERKPEYYRYYHDSEKVRSVLKTLHQQAGWSEEDVVAWDRSFFESKSLEQPATPQPVAQQHSTLVKQNSPRAVMSISK